MLLLEERVDFRAYSWVCVCWSIMIEGNINVLHSVSKLKLISFSVDQIYLHNINIVLIVISGEIGWSLYLELLT